MRAVVQRVDWAKVSVDGEVVGEIGCGFLVLLGIFTGDGPGAEGTLAAKLAKLRIFMDAEGRMNRSLLDVSGAALVVSQFTLCADTRKGNRPSFMAAAAPDEANARYEAFCEALAGQGVPVARGRFGAHMDVTLHNDGPVTVVVDV